MFCLLCHPPIITPIGVQRQALLTERLLSTDIDPNLTQAGMGSRKGLFVSGQAEKFPFTGIFDTAGPVTLLGLVQTQEGPAPWAMDRSYMLPTFDNSTPIPTAFSLFD